MQESFGFSLSEFFADGISNGELIFCWFELCSKIIKMCEKRMSALNFKIVQKGRVLSTVMKETLWNRQQHIFEENFDLVKHFV